jgi:hypothetical protein
VRVALAVMLLLAGAAPVSAQVDGYISLLVDVLPDVGDGDDWETVSELRARIFLERREDIGEHVRLNLAGYVDGLVADRGATGGSGATADAAVGASDLYVDVLAPRFDVRVGASRLVWGRLDEFQPTDVVNPIDLTRFLLEGRSEARLAVGLVRGRLFLPGSSTLEAVVVPAFRASRFDQLDEVSSPFNLIPSAAPGEGGAHVRDERREPDLAWTNLQGGARFTSTLGRVDWGVSAYRGFRTFPTLTLAGGPSSVAPTDETRTMPSMLSAGPETRTASPAVLLVQSFPRFTMVGGEFETVRGPWGLRGEAAAFVEDELQSTRAARGVPGRSVEAGLGVDRRAGDYRIAANVLCSWRAVDRSDPRGAAFADDDELAGSDVTLVVAANRNFARETRRLRVFGVYDPGEGTAFGRVIAAVSVRDNISVEGSAGIFAGSSLDTIGRLTERDFLYARLKVLF